MRIKEEGAMQDCLSKNVETWMNERCRVTKVKPPLDEVNDAGPGRVVQVLPHPWKCESRTIERCRWSREVSLPAW